MKENNVGIEIFILKQNEFLRYKVILEATN
jgi:hypothetical protein